MVKKRPCENTIQKAESCPPELIGGHFSRWGVTKLRFKETLLSASRRHSFQSDALMPKDYADSNPIALVGPVIGLVTSTSARILLEVDRNARVEMILHKEEVPNMGDLTDDPYKGSFSQRLIRGSSSPAWLNPLKFKRSPAMEAVLLTAESISSTESSVHSHDDVSNDSPDDESTSSKERRAKRSSKLRPLPGSSPLKLWRKSSLASLQRDSSSRKTENDPPSEDCVDSIGSPDSSSVRKSAEKRRSNDVRGTETLRRRGSRSFTKLWRGSSLGGMSSPLRKQSTHYLSQGGGSESKAINVVKEMEARRPCVFMFTTLEPESRYRVEVKDCHEVEQSSFKTFPIKIPKKFCMASISCNSIFITKKTITGIDDLWHHLHKSIESNEIDLLIHLGDQIYGDGDRHLDASAGKNRDIWSNRFKIALHMLSGLRKEEWASKQEEICEKYKEVYRDTWKHPSTAKCLAHCPSLMIYDDHEIRDNWGDNPRDCNKDCKEYFVARCAWTVTLEYQRQLFEDVDFSNLDAIQKDYYFHVIDKIGLMFLDIRGSRTFHRVENDKTPYLGSRQWEDIDKALGHGGVFDNVRILVVCSPAPLVFLVPSLTVAAPTCVNRLEDFKGHWSKYKNEQRRMIDSLRRWKESGEGREVIVLGGDVHCGGHSCILESGKTLFYQLTTSPIANMPLSKTVYYAMRFAEQFEKIQGFQFHHFNWTRARNYGLVHVNFCGEDENEVPEIITELVRGKFLRPVKMGRRVSNLETYTRTMCCTRSPLQWCKAKMVNMALTVCDKNLEAGGMSSPKFEQDGMST